MKNALTKIVPGLLSVAVIIAVFFSAASAETTNTVLSGLITPTSPEETTTMEQRLSARKAKVQLSANDKASIAAKCTLAQTAINDRKTKDVKASAIRLQSYNELVKRLTFLVDNLSSQGNDATQLLNAESYFVASINSYLANAQKYKVAMDDLVIMDCKSDPTGFRATLEEARKLRAQLSLDVAAIKNNLGNLKSQLSKSRQDLITGQGKKS
jgi:hypothetical protein